LRHATVELLFVEIFIRTADANNDIAGLFIIVLADGDEQFQQILLQRGGDVPDPCRGQSARYVRHRSGKHFRGGVGVEYAVHHDLFQIGFEQFLG
jgi:hypothetical protein